MSKKNVKFKSSIGIKNLFLLAICLILIIMILIPLSHISFGSSKNHSFKIDSRVEKVKSVKLPEDSSFRSIGWIRIQGTDIDYPIIHSSALNAEFPVHLENYVWSQNYDAKFHNMPFYK